MSKLLNLLVFIVAVTYFSVAEAEPKEVCVPGSNYNDGCNTCTCLPEGIDFKLLCTRKICRHNRVKKPAPEGFWKRRVVTTDSPFDKKPALEDFWNLLGVVKMGYPFVEKPAPEGFWKRRVVTTDSPFDKKPALEDFWNLLGIVTMDYPVVEKPAPGFWEAEVVKTEAPIVEWIRYTVKKY